MRTLLLLPILLLGLFLTPAHAETSAVPDIHDLEWLVGTWTGEHFGEAAFSTYSGPVGNVITGAYQVVNAEGITTITEFDYIEATEKGLFWHYAIYGPGMEPMESPFGQSGVYRLEFDGEHAVNYFDDSGKTAMVSGRMELLDDGRMKSTVVLKGEKGEQTIEFFSDKVE